MNKSNSGWLAALLVFAALLVGVVALSTVGGEAEKPKAETKPAAEKSAPEAVAATQEAPAAPSPAAGAEASDRRLDEILRVLASAGTIPPELRDPAFDYYVDLTLLGNAWADLDAALLTDLTLQIVEGERVLLRPHRVVRSSDLLEVAIRLAAAKNDEATLARLEKAVQRSENLDLAAQLAEARKLAADATATDAVWMVPVETTSAPVFARYKGFLQDIVAALVVRDRSTLENLEKELGSAADLPEAHRASWSEKSRPPWPHWPRETRRPAQQPMCCTNWPIRRGILGRIGVCPPLQAGGCPEAGARLCGATHRVPTNRPNVPRSRWRRSVP